MITTNPLTFWSNVERSDGDCWPWRKSRNRNGYVNTKFLFNGNVVSLAHRIAWTLTNGDIPADMWVLHKCDNPPCCNPDHLFIGTAKDNNRDASLKGRSPAAK